MCSVPLTDNENIPLLIMYNMINALYAVNQGPGPFLDLSMVTSGKENVSVIMLTRHEAPACSC